MISYRRAAKSATAAGLATIISQISYSSWISYSGRINHNSWIDYSSSITCNSWIS